MASASLKTSTGAPAALPFSAADSTACSAKPFTCCRLGDSSTTPLRMIPGKPMPTASNFSPPAAFSTSPRMHSAMSVEGMDCKGSSDCAVSGKSFSAPTTLLPSTRPAAICSITKTPTVLLMVLPPVLCYPSFYKSLREIPRRYARLRRASLLGMTGFLYLILSLAPSAQESETASALTSACGGNR